MRTMPAHGATAAPAATGRRRYQVCRSQLVPIMNTGVRWPGESVPTSAFRSAGR